VVAICERLGIVTVATVNLRDFATVRPRHIPCSSPFRGSASLEPLRCWCAICVPMKILAIGREGFSQVRDPVRGDRERFARPSAAVVDRLASVQVKGLREDCLWDWERPVKPSAQPQCQEFKGVWSPAWWRVAAGHDVVGWLFLVA
jgi:hypothetical protein